jgi:hypothetical protein
MMHASKNTVSDGHVHILPSGNRALSQMFSIVVRSHHATPMFTTAATTVPSYAAHLFINGGGRGGYHPNLVKP